MMCNTNGNHFSSRVYFIFLLRLETSTLTTSMVNGPSKQEKVKKTKTKKNDKKQSKLKRTRMIKSSSLPLGW